jgi:DinB family protein
MTNTELADLRRQLANTPVVVRTVLTGLPADLLHVNEGDGTWSPMQVVAHLAWGERDDWIPRVRKTLEKGVTESFTPFDREAGFAVYADWRLDRLLDEFARLRAGSLEALDGFALTPSDLTRQGRHPEFGPVTLEQLLATWITHDFAHLTQIARILARHHGKSVGPWRKYFSLLRDDSRP